MPEKIYHPTLACCSEVQTICDELFAFTGLTYFNYVRVYKDQSRISLCNNYDWASFFLNSYQKYPIIFEEEFCLPQSNYLIWDMVENLRDDPLLLLAKEQFDIDHGITLTHDYKHFTEFFYFATTTTNEAINLFYINQQELLSSFILYFKDKARELINSAEEQRYQLNIPKLTLGPSYPFKEFFDICKIDRFFLNGDLKDVYLSGREAECLTYIYEGLTLKETGHLLDISHRTVDTYLEQIKRKMNCRYKNEVIKKAKCCGFDVIRDVILARSKAKVLV